MNRITSRARAAVATLTAVASAIAFVTVANAAAFSTWAGAVDLTSSGYSSYVEFDMSTDGTSSIAMWDVDNKIQSATASTSGSVSTWSSTTTLESADAGGEYHVAMSDDGAHAVAIWQYCASGCPETLKAAVATVSNGVATWGTAVTLETTGAVLPRIAMSANGSKVTAVWLKDNNVRVASATVSGTTATWGAVTTLSDGSAESNEVQFGLSADGTKATVLWQETPSNEFMQTRSGTISGNASTWGATQTLTVTPGYAKYPRIAISADGTKVAGMWVWQVGGDQNAIQIATASVSGTTATWSTVTSLTDPSDDRDTDYPDIAISENGAKIVAVWQRESVAGSSPWTIESAVATVASNVATWGANSSVSAAGSNSYAAKISITPDASKAITTWYGMSGTYLAKASLATISGTTATWATPVDMSASGGWAFYPRARISGDGAAATVLWVRDGLIQASATGNATKAVTATPDIDLKLKLNVGSNIKSDNLKVQTSGSGLGANVPYTVVLRSTPIQIGSGTTNSSGSFTNSSPLPANTPAGSHSVTVYSTDASGNRVSSVGYFSVDSNGDVTAVSYVRATPVPSQNLPGTGMGSFTIAALAIAFVLSGLAIVLASRRRVN